MNSGIDLLKFEYKGVKFKIFNSNFGVIDVKKLMKLKTELEFLKICLHLQKTAHY